MCVCVLVVFLCVRARSYGIPRNVWDPESCSLPPKPKPPVPQDPPFVKLGHPARSVGSRFWWYSSSLGQRCSWPDFRITCPADAQPLFVLFFV